MDIHEIIIFTIDKKKFALPTFKVKELLRAVAIQPLPNHEDLIQGVITIRGSIVPVINLRACFKQAAKPPTPSDFFIAINHNDKVYAILVDHIEGIEAVPKGCFEYSDDSSSFTLGIAKIQNEIAVVLDINFMFDNIDAPSSQTTIAQPSGEIES